MAWLRSSDDAGIIGVESPATLQVRLVGLDDLSPVRVEVDLGRDKWLRRGRFRMPAG